uniref:Putative transporter n=1 Tax=Pseudomonas nitroreducens TaxID=46680 RepID=C3VA12_PSENT|nr:putative transporter [Pseudomonas nitroreducens]
MASRKSLSRLFERRVLVAVACAALTGFQATYVVGADTPQVLNETSMLSHKASKSVLLSVARAGDRIVAVGERGIVLLSDDAGKTWRQAKVPVSVSLTAVQFVDPSHGWAVGHLGVVLHTEDGGETWVKQLDGIAAVEALVDYAKNDPNVQDRERAIKDSEWMLADGPDKPFLDLYFADKSNGFIVGAYGLLFKTSDGGKTWMPWASHISNPSNLHLNAISASGGKLYIAGERGLLLRSLDGGASFETLKSPYEGSYFGIVAAKTGELVVFGLRGKAFWSADNGSTWVPIEIKTDAAIASGTELSDGSLLMVSQVGELFVNDPRSSKFRNLSWRGVGSTSDVVEMRTGELSIVGLHGVENALIKSSVAR